MVYDARKYTVEGNKPVLILHERQDWDFGKKQFHCVVEHRKGTEMVIRRDEWGISKNGEGPCDPGKLFAGFRGGRDQ